MDSRPQSALGKSSQPATASESAEGGLERARSSELPLPGFGSRGGRGARGEGPGTGNEGREPRHDSPAAQDLPASPQSPPIGPTAPLQSIAGLLARALPRRRARDLLHLPPSDGTGETRPPSAQKTRVVPPHPRIPYPEFPIKGRPLLWHEVVVRSRKE